MSEDVNNNTGDGEEPHDTAGSQRMSAVVQAPPGYHVVDAWIAYAHNDIVEHPPTNDEDTPFKVPDYLKSIQALVDRRFKGLVVITPEESRTRSKDNRQHIAWQIFIDTPQTAAARKPVRGNGKRPTEKDVPKLLKEVSAAMLDESVVADAQRLGVTPKQAARAKVAATHALTVEELQELITAFLSD